MPGPEDLFLEDGSGGVLESFQEALRVDQEYASGVREIDQEWVRSCLDNPETGELLERNLHSLLSAGKHHDPEKLAAVDTDVRTIIAAINDPNVILTGRLAKKRDAFLQLLDMINPKNFERQGTQK